MIKYFFFIVSLANACMQDSQCNLDETLPPSCCYMNICTDINSIECESGRYYAWQYLRQNTKVHPNAIKIAK